MNTTLVRQDDDEIDPLDRLAEEFLERTRRGERPSVDEFARRLAGQSGEVRELLDALMMVEGLKPGIESTLVPPGWGDHGGGFARIERLGDYRIVREIGRGGMGVVFEAEQISLGRHVALKVLASSATRSPVQVLRFLREAQSAARLHHTNIVPVFGVGDQDGHFYYAMQFIQGLGLDKVLDEIRRRRLAGPARGDDPGTTAEPSRAVPEPTEALDADTLRAGLGKAPSPTAGGGAPDAHRPTADPVSFPGEVSLADASGSGRLYARSVARLGAQVAEALEYAHQQGTLHRDIKPSNLLLDQKGNVWVADFGLAKVSEGDELTRTGDLVGTLRYMAPERFRGLCDARSDVHALGLTLYEMLALRPAFDAADRHGLIFEMTHREPPRLRSLGADVPRDLETIVHKAIERVPSHRYATAGAMAADLRAFLEGQPIAARQIGPAERLARWAARNPGLAALVGAVAGLLALTFVVITLAYVRVDSERAQALTNLGRAMQAERQAGDKLVESSISRVRALRLSGRVGRRFEALRALDDAARGDFDGRHRAECRDEAIACLALADLDPVPIGGSSCHGIVPNGLDVDHDRDRVAYGRPDGEIVVESLDGERKVSRFAGDGRPAVQLRLGPDGRHLAARTERNGRSGFRVYDLETERAVLDVPEGGYHGSFDFHPTAPIVAAGRRDGSIVLYDLTDGGEHAHLSPGAVPWAIRFDPSGTRLAVASPRSDRPLQIRQVDDGRVVAEASEPEGARALDWHPDGRWLAAAGEDGRIRLIDTEDPSRPHRILEGHAGPVPELVHHPGGDLLASAGDDGTIRLWDLPTGRELVEGALLRPWRLRFSGDGSVLGPGDVGRAPGTWRVATGREFAPVVTSGGPGRSVRSIATLGGSDLLAVAADDGIRVTPGGGHCTTAAAEALARMPGTTAATVAPDGGSLISGGASGLLRWPVSGPPGGPIRVGPPVPIGPGPGQPTTRHALARDGRALAAILDDEWGRVVVVDPEGESPPIELAGHPGVDRVAVSPDGRLVATSSRDGGGVRLWDARLGTVVATLPVDGPSGVAFSPGGRHLLTGEATRYRLWDLEDQSEVWEIPREQVGDLPGEATFRDDGQILAIARTRSIVQLVDPEDGRILASLEPPNPHDVTGLAFEPGGNLLVLSPGVDAVRRWDLSALRRGLDALDLGDDALAAGRGGDRPSPADSPPAPPAFAEPAPWLAPFARGEDATRAERWDDAAAAYREAIAAGAPGVDPWARLALVAAASGDSAAYREACARLLSRFADTAPVPKVANNVAWACALAPWALEDYEPAHALALGSASSDREPSRWNTVGAVLYRAGRHDEAIAQFGRSIATHGAGGTAYDALFLAMAHHRLGHHEEAERWFARAMKPSPTAMRKPDVAGPSSWIPTIELRLLRIEASVLLRPPPP